jgi:hypothetical protein
MLPRTSAFAAVAAVVFVLPALAKPKTVVFDAPNAGTVSFAGTQVFGMSKNGEVAGSAYGNDFSVHGFVRHPDGTYLTFTSGASYYQPYGVNAGGNVTGIFQDGSTTKGFVAKASGKAKAFQASDDALYTAPNWIGDKGDVAGYYGTSGNINHGFVRNKKGKTEVFDAPGASLTSNGGTNATFVDAHGTVAGSFFDTDLVSHGYLRAPDGTFTVITDPSAGTGSRQGTKILSVNTSGEAAGYYIDAQGATHGLIWKAGAFTHFDVKDLVNTHARTINAKGAVTGWASDANGATHGYVRSSKGKITVFDPPGSGTASGQGTLSQGIADDGSVSGFFLDNANVYHGFIRTP